MNVEVFATNVTDPDQARWLAAEIERSFDYVQVNFDLDDGDRILRVVGPGMIQADEIIAWLSRQGCQAQVLPDICY